MQLPEAQLLKSCVTQSELTFSSVLSTCSSHCLHWEPFVLIIWDNWALGDSGNSTHRHGQEVSLPVAQSWQPVISRVLAESNKL